MMIKFLAHGKGSATKAAAYLLSSNDHMGIKRSGVKTLRGSGELFSAIADSSGFSQRYTSGVIAFAPTDAPSDKEIENVLASFENLAFAGLQRDDYHFFAVLHEEEDGSKHVHVMTPRVHLKTGKSLNIAPPGHTKAFYAWRDMLNEKHGWASPADPLRRRLVNVPPHRVRVRNEAVAQGLLLETDPRQFIADSIEKAVWAGSIKDRADVEHFLKNDLFYQEENGVVSRVVRNSISVRLRREDGTLAAPIRLTGAFFDSGFNAEEFLINEKMLRAGVLDAEHEHKPDVELIKRLNADIALHTERRAAYNKKRYGSLAPAPVVNQVENYDTVTKRARERETTAERVAALRASVSGADDRIRELRASANRAERRADELRASIDGADDRIRELRKSVAEREQQIIVVAGSIKQHKEQQQRQLAAITDDQLTTLLSHAQAELRAAPPVAHAHIRRNLTDFVRWSLYLHESDTVPADHPLITRFMQLHKDTLDTASQRLQGRFMREQDWSIQERAGWLIQAQTYRFDFNADIAEQRVEQQHHAPPHDPNPNTPRGG